MLLKFIKYIFQNGGFNPPSWNLGLPVINIRKINSAVCKLFKKVCRLLESTFWLKLTPKFPITVLPFSKNCFQVPTLSIYGVNYLLMSDVLVTFMYVPHCAASNRITPARLWRDEPLARAGGRTGPTLKWPLPSSSVLCFFVWRDGMLAFSDNAGVKLLGRINEALVARSGHAGQPCGQQRMSGHSGQCACAVHEFNWLVLRPLWVMQVWVWTRLFGRRRQIVELTGVRAIFQLLPLHTYLWSVQRKGPWNCQIWLCYRK